MLLVHPSALRRHNVNINAGRIGLRHAELVQSGDLAGNGCALGPHEIGDRGFARFDLDGSPVEKRIAPVAEILAAVDRVGAGSEIVEDVLDMLLNGVTSFI